jgi:hypothetical protein
MNSPFRTRCQALLLALAAGTAAAQSPAPAAPPPARAEIRQAEDALHAAAARLVELQRQQPEHQLLIRETMASFQRPMLGVVLQDDDQAGVRLAAVTPGGPAERAGLRSGDRLLAIDGRAISGDDPAERLLDARAAIGRPADGQTIALDIERDGRRQRLSVTAAPLPAFRHGMDPARIEALQQRLQPMIDRDFHYEIGRLMHFPCTGDDADCAPVVAALRWRGLRMARVDAELGRYFGTDRGVLVLAVDREQLAPLRPGDVLLDVDGTAVDDPGEVMRVLQGRAVGEPVALTVQRDQRAQPMTIAAPAFSRLPAPPAPPRPPLPPAPPKAAPAPPAPAAPPPPEPPPGLLQ